MRVYKWLEFKVRPKKDGLHDSGYRHIQLTGVYRTDTGVEKESLHQWADHVVLNGPVNIDVEADGTIRLMPWGHSAGWEQSGGEGFYSSATFRAADKAAAVRYVELGL